MKILALEASGGTAGCALTGDGKVLGALDMNIGKTHSQTMVPMLDALRKMTDLDLTSLDAIAVTAGPGSFTGLRIGAATAKGIALALEKPIIPVSTLESLAFNLFGTDALLCPIMDARRQQVYTAVYEGVKGKIRPAGATVDAAPGAVAAEDAAEGESPAEEISAVPDTEDPAVGGAAAPAGYLPCLLAPAPRSIGDLIEELNALGREAIFSGDGVPVYREVIDGKLKVPHSYAPGHLSLQRAAATALLAERLVREHGETAMVSSDDFRPVYLRKTQAEQQKEKAEQSGRMAALAAGRLIRETRAEAAAGADGTPPAAAFVKDKTGPADGAGLI